MRKKINNKKFMKIKYMNLLIIKHKSILVEINKP